MTDGRRWLSEGGVLLGEHLLTPAKDEGAVVTVSADSGASRMYVTSLSATGGRCAHRSRISQAFLYKRME